MKKQKVAVSWEMCGFIYVEANTLKEAIQKVEEDPDSFALPTESYYIDESFQVDTEDDEDDYDDV